jgi:hypothetical protein
MKSSNITEIINRIPLFLDRVIENITSKIHINYGDYKIDRVYSINEFISNPNLSIFRVKQEMLGKNASSKTTKKTKSRYIILSDVYLLLLDSSAEDKSQGQLLFIGDIRHVFANENTKIIKDTINIEWENSIKNVFI